MSFKNRYNPEEQQYVYHYSAQKFTEIKNRKMLGLPAPEQASNPEEYNQNVSLLPAPLTRDVIENYRGHGFTAWGRGPLYEYKISIPKNMSAFPGEIRLTSTPDQLQYNRRHSFDKAFSDQGIDRQRVIRDNKYWEEVKDNYIEIKEKYKEAQDKYVKHMISPSLTSRNYSSHPYIKKLIDSFDFWVDFNLRKGDKSQYASYIPHIHTNIDKPLIPESVTQII